MTAIKDKKQRRRRMLAKLSFWTLGISSTLWFLFRVIPKPTRATYPCMQAAAPIMSSFVIWLLGAGTSLFFLKQSKELFRKAKYVTAVVFLALGLSLGIISLVNNSIDSKANIAFADGDDFPANEPMGEAQGIYPGRVVWAWNPDATNENSTMQVNEDGYIDNDDDVYYVPKNNDEDVIDEMVSDIILKLTGAETQAAAWDSLFRFHNRKRENSDVGYSSGEKIFIKTNNQGVGLPHTMTEDLRQEDKIVWSSFPPHMAATSPYPVLATIKLLVNEAGVPEDMIYVGDPHNNFNSVYYDIFREHFPDIHIMGVNSSKTPDCEAHGRTLSQHGEEPVVYYSDQGKILDEAIDFLYQQVVDAKYMINIAALKSHIRGGITLFCKSHFGTHTRSAASHLHPGLVSPDGHAGNTGYGKYRVLVDIMAHEHLGGKTMLYLLDGLWGGPPHELHAPRKWKMAPFNNDWTSSVFGSVDPVAISSVAYDILRTEYNQADWGGEAYANYSGVDDYLHQAADKSNWPDDITYDPEGDGTEIPSLGVHEHWNNAQDMQYSRNLDPENGTGIELVRIPEITTSNATPQFTKDVVRVYPNPVTDNVSIVLQNNYKGIVRISVQDLEGKTLSSYQYTKRTEQLTKQIALKNLEAGYYIISVYTDQQITNKKILKTK